MWRDHVRTPIYNSVSVNYKVSGKVLEGRTYIVGTFTFNMKKALEVDAFYKYCENYCEILLTPSEGDCSSFLFIRARQQSYYPRIIIFHRIKLPSLPLRPPSIRTGNQCNYFPAPATTMMMMMIPSNILTHH